MCPEPGIDNTKEVINGFIYKSFDGGTPRSGLIMNDCSEMIENRVDYLSELKSIECVNLESIKCIDLLEQDEEDKKID